MANYEFDSLEKQAVRCKWIEFIKSVKELSGDNNPLSLMTLPSQEFQEIILYADEGLIKTELMDESGVTRIIEGKVVCFEKSPKKFRVLSEKLTNAMTSMEDIGQFFRRVRPKFVNGANVKEFPVDVVNMDFDSSLAKMNVPIFEIIENMFYYQNIHKKNFAFFITFPQSESSDPEDYKQKLTEIIQSNLQDQTSDAFRIKFEEIFGKIDDLDYENRHVIGFLKWLVRFSSDKKFKIVDFLSFKYGDKELKVGSRKRMHSLLFQFEFSEQHISRNNIYYEDIMNAFKEQIDLKE